MCSIYVLKNGNLESIGDFGKTHFRDLDSDGVPEVLSVGLVSFGFVGDHWLTIHKWNGHGYTDVSKRFPREYDPVICDLRREIHLLRYTNYHGNHFTPASYPDLFADMYYALGKAYEYRGFPDKARVQYGIAYRLNPENEDVANAFHHFFRR